MNTLSEYYNEWFKKEIPKVTGIIENYFISKVMDETGLSRDCSIKYIHKYCNINYDIQGDELIATMELKTIGELLDEDIDFPYECVKQSLEYQKK